jgi:hypothetical protein
VDAGGRAETQGSGLFISGSELARGRGVHRSVFAAAAVVWVTPRVGSYGRPSVTRPRNRHVRDMIAGYRNCNEMS